MTKREQVLAVLNGEKTEQIPRGFWLHFPEGFENGQPAIDMHLKFFEESGTSICKIMNENTMPNLPHINTAADLDKMESVSHDDPIIVNQVALVKEICLSYAVRREQLRRGKGEDRQDASGES